MEKAVFKTRFLEAAVAAREFARNFILEPLPDDLVFRVRLNCSYDGNPLHGDEVVFPEDGSLERAESAAELVLDGVVDLLWRERRVPEWIDVSVIGETGARTVLGVLSCGRYTENEEFLYHQHEGRPPFHVTGPVLPVDYEEGSKFSIHLRTECWSSRDVDILRRHATKVWALDLCGRQFQDAALASLPALPSVEVLELRGVRVEGPGLAGLAQAPKLRVLRAHFADIKELDLTKLPVLPELQSLDLNGLPASVRGFHRIGEVAACVFGLARRPWAPEVT